MVLLSGGEPVSVEATLEAGFKITAAQLEADYAKTKWFLFNSPPTLRGGIWLGRASSFDRCVDAPPACLGADALLAKAKHLSYIDFKFCTPAQVELQL
jgi:aspartate aminotransferase